MSAPVTAEPKKLTRIVSLSPIDNNLCGLQTDQLLKRHRSRRRSRGGITSPGRLIAPSTREINPTTFAASMHHDTEQALMNAGFAIGRSEDPAHLRLHRTRHSRLSSVLRFFLPQCD